VKEKQKRHSHLAGFPQYRDQAVFQKEIDIAPLL